MAGPSLLILFFLSFFLVLNLICFAAEYLELYRILCCYSAVNVWGSRLAEIR